MRDKVEEITTKLFFKHLAKMDTESLDQTHIVIPDSDQTMGLSVDKDFVNITGQYYGSEEVERVQITRNTFDCMVEMYKAMVEVGNG